MTIEKDSNFAVHQILQNKWSYTESFMRKLLIENAELAENLADQIILDARRFSDEQLTHYLNTINLADENAFRPLIEDVIKGVYFRDIPADWNDPFVMIIGKNREEDSFILTDFSENCSIEDYASEGEIVRYMEDEYRLHADPVLARHAFNNIMDFKSGEIWEGVNFFQFLDWLPSAARFESYDYRGLRKAFFDNDGDLRKTFGAIEILTPYYIYRDRDIVGNPRIVNRQISDTRIIVVVSAFNPYDIMVRDYDFNARTRQYLQSIENIRLEHQKSKTFLLKLNLLLLVIDILGIALIYAVLINLRKKSGQQ